MKNHHIALPLACSVSILLGLAVPAHAQTQAPSLHVEPVMKVQNSEMGLDAWYKLGRFHQENKRYDQAAEAYRQVLEHDPNNIDARNALATVYALQNRFDEAIAEFKIVLKDNSKLAYVYNNLGYAYFLKADYLNAISAFGNAIAIEPRNSRTFGNLMRAYEQLGMLPASAAPALTPLEQAKESKTLKQNASAPASPVTKIAAASPAPQPADSASSTKAMPPVLAGIAIEIANGTHDTGLGEYVAKALRQDGATITRVTGMKSYTQHRNVILYQRGFHKQALAVSRHFTNPPAVVSAPYHDSGSGHANMRLVLGKEALQSTHAAGGSAPDTAF